MNELYWIGRCAIVHEIASFVMFAGLIAAAILGVFVFFSYLEDALDSENWERIRSWFKKIAVVVAASLVFYTFIPSKKEMHLILGVGGTIDYILSNDNAQQLPGKCIDAINTWVESLNEKEK